MKKGVTTSTSLLSGSHGLCGERGIVTFCGEEGQGFCFYDDLSQARWNWLIMIFKVCFFCRFRCTAAAAFAFAVFP